MTATLLQIVTEFCDRTGLTAPTVVMSSTDDQIKQIRGLANEIITDVTGRGTSWPLLQKEGHFTSVAAESQGTILAAAPYGFKYLIDETFFDRTERRPLFGPRSAARWQEGKALPSPGPNYSFRFWQGNIYAQPTMPAAHEVYFEYASDWAIKGATTPTDATQVFRKRYLYDADVFQLNEDILLLGLRWKWKAEKGLNYVKELQDYEALLALEMGTDGTKGQLDMAGGCGGDIKPGIWVPAGSWNVP